MLFFLSGGTSPQLGFASTAAVAKSGASTPSRARSGRASVSSSLSEEDETGIREALFAALEAAAERVAIKSAAASPVSAFAPDEHFGGFPSDSESEEDTVDAVPRVFGKGKNIRGTLTLHAVRAPVAARKQQLAPVHAPAPRKKKKKAKKKKPIESHVSSGAPTVPAPKVTSCINAASTACSCCRLVSWEPNT